jgi:hypothetical protein
MGARNGGILSRDVMKESGRERNVQRLHNNVLDFVPAGGPPPDDFTDAL